mgnify:CR=1 FL=1
MKEPVLHVSNAKTMLAYPEVIPGANKWVFSNTATLKDGDGTIRVTEYGLKRLLRLAAKVYPYVQARRWDGLVPDEVHNSEPLKGVREMYEKQITPEKTVDLINELCTIFCEGDLVMSRLFVDADGHPFAHKDDEVDAASVPPSETPNQEQQ